MDKGDTIMKLIPLTQGKFAMVDDEDYEELMRYKWYCHLYYKKTMPYASRNIYHPNQKTILMHRVIMGIVDKNIMVDHIDSNTLNNQKNNLRICSGCQNQHNSGVKGGVSQYKGVSRCQGIKNKWRATISCNKKWYAIGRYETEIDAAMAYDSKAKELHKDFARLNFKE